LKTIKNLFRLNVSPSRIYGLDILRALAIWFVLYAHALTYIQNIIPIKYARWGMYDGVSIFFTLSGFLIGGILIKILENNRKPTFSTLWDFWKRRWLRTLPNYFLVLTILVVYFSLFREFRGIHVWEYYLFIQNLWQPQPWFFGESWSLSIEEWFYLITPLGVFILMRLLKLKTLHSLLIVALGLIVYSTIQRINGYTALAPNDLNLSSYNAVIRTQISTRLDSIMFGVLAACLKHYAPQLWLRSKNALFAIGLSLLFFYFFHRNDIEVYFIGIFGPTIIALGVAFILPFFHGVKTGKGILYKVITYVSLTSYSAYLINLGIVQDIVLLNLKKLFPQNMGLESQSATLLVLFFSFTFVGATLLYKYFELPIMKLRDKKK
jgi:peptidoglycan/LPS O-acetylase OafA/YrhL